MATRTSRRGTKEHTPIVTPPSSTGSSRIRSPSPLSPTRVTRKEEKHQLQQLNNRLAGYIDRVRSLNSHIGSLESKVASIEETKHSEITSIKFKYDKELGYTRKALDDVAKERAKLQIDAEKLERENRDLRIENSQREKNCNDLEKQIKALMAKIAALTNDVDDLRRDVNILRPENAKLKKKLEDARKNLEAETLQRIDAQNQLQTSQEGLKFDNEVLQTQLNETRRIKAVEISEMDGKYREEYDSKLREQLESMRSSYESLMDSNRGDINRKYDADLEKYKRLYAESRSSGAGQAQELREYQTKISGLVSRNSELEASNSALNTRMSELLREMEDSEACHRRELAQRDEELRSKDEEMESMLKDYNALMEIKVALDMEIAAYQKLLEGEEARLGLSQVESPSSSMVSSSGKFSSFFDSGSGFGKGMKRKRILEEESESYDTVSELKGKPSVIIEPLDDDAKGITISNHTDDDISIGGWKLSCIVGSKEEELENGVDTVFKFHRSIVLPTGSSSTVYSSDATDVDHSPPTSLIMKNKSWSKGEYSVVTLTNKDEEVESIRVTKKIKSYSSKRHDGGGSSSGEIYHHSGDPSKCSVM
ncbi:lamin Dm0 [Lepeophtheirus salmonis]|uniref:lamin Dm0 n=1 Tax=Lepeophtheirus salmonis TaxID=72036 RepID=UPI001AE45FFE|nr:lamin Dm0-like [Lepeophtheirus salmonis]